MLKPTTEKFKESEKYRVAKKHLLQPKFNKGYLSALLLIMATSSAAYAFRSDSYALNFNQLPQTKIVHKVRNNSDFSVDNINGTSGQDIRIRVNLPAIVTGNSGSKTWLRIIGLPDDLKLSKGSKVNNIWFMSMQDLPGLTLQSPKNFNGQHNVKFFLMRGDSSVVTIIGQTSVNIDLRPISKTTTRSKSASIAQKPAIQAPAITGTVPPEVERQTEERAKKFLKMGDIATARMLYENLSVQGSAKAAFLLGQTYDPEFLKKLLVRGLRPDVDKAKSWYKKALEISRNNGLNFANGKPVFNIYLDQYSKHLGIKTRELTETQKEVFQSQYKLM